MNKMNEIQLRGGYVLKTYRDENINNVLDLIDKLNNSMTITGIVVEEGVEADMKTYDGMEYSIQALKDNYSILKSHAKELSFRIKGTFNDAPISVGIGEGNNIITLMTNSEGLELDNIITPNKVESLNL